MYVDPITRQTFNYANHIPCENNQQNVIALDPDTDQKYVVTPQPIKKTLLYYLNQLIQTDISSDTFTAQDACIHAQKELKHSRNRVLFRKHSDNTLHLLCEAINYAIMSKQSSKLLPINLFKSL